MNTTSHQLNQLTKDRCKELTPYIYQKTGGKVLTGPFTGMVIVPKTADNGHVASKLLGVYEDELHDWIYDAVESNPDLVMNIGCAEGYYAVGLCRLLPNVAAMAVDIDIKANSAISENLMANVINGLDVYVRRATCEWIEDRLNLTEKPLIVMDCEGEEITLLDPNCVPSLLKTRVIVECYDTPLDSITDTLIKRFSATHTIQQTISQYKDPYQFEFLKEFSDSDKCCLVNECRATSATWLYMVPKK